MFDKILLAVDGSEHAKKAIAAAVELASCTGGEVLVVHVHPRGVVTRETEYVESKDEARLLTVAAQHVVEEGGVKARAELREARDENIAKAIIDAAHDFGAEAIVIGSRGMGAFAELFLGSVAHKVIQLAECPVMVVTDHAQLAREQGTREAAAS